MNKMILAIVILGLAFLYIILPVDLVPELVLGPIGYIDDLCVFLGAVWFLFK